MREEVIWRATRGVQEKGMREVIQEGYNMIERGGKESARRRWRGPLTTDHSQTLVRHQ